MKTVYLYALRKARGQMLGWGLALFALDLLLVPFYGSIAQMGEQLEQLLALYPEEVLAFFGDMARIGTPAGFLDIEFFSYMPLVLGIFAVLAGSGLLAADEESGYLDLLMGLPISRLQFFLGRLMAFLTTALGICFIGWLGLALPLPFSEMDLTALQLAQPFLPLLAIIFLFGSLTLLLSTLVPSRRLAAMLGGIALVASFFIEGFSRIIEDLQPLAKLLPLHYYQSGSAFDGLNWDWLAGLCAAGLLFTALAAWRFQRKDLRVRGEGGWAVQLT
jgi:ABC-2 type transport system permease protein